MFNRIFLIFCLCCFLPTAPAQSTTFDYTTIWTHLADTECQYYQSEYGGLVDLAIKGNFAYSVDDYGGLHILDCTNPLDVVYQSFNHLPNEPRRIDIWDHYVYVTNDANTLQVIDVDDPEYPMLLTQIDTGSPINDLLIVSPMLYVANESGAVRIYSLSSASNPALVNIVNLPQGHTWRLALDNGLIIAAGDSGLSVIDPAIPDWPSVIGSYNFQGDTRDLSARDGLAAVGQIDQSLLLDFTDPTNIVQVAILPHTGQGVHLTGNNQLWLGWEYCSSHGGMRIYDISDPSSPVWLHFEIRGFRGGPRTMVEIQGLVYVAEHVSWCAGEFAGFHIFQTGDFPLPEPLATQSYSNSYGLLRYDDVRIDLATGEGFISLDLSDPTSPQLIGVTDPGYIFYDPDQDNGMVACIRSHGYPQARLQILTRDINGNLESRGSYTLNHFPNKLAMSGSLVLLALGWDPGGVLAFDITDPDSPTLLGELFPGETITALDLHGDLAAVTIARVTNIYDLSDLSNPVFLSTLNEGPSENRSDLKFEEYGGKVLLHAAIDDYYDGGYAEVHDVTNPDDPTRLISLRQIAMDEIGPLIRHDGLIAVPGTKQLTFYSWPNLDGPAEFLGRFPLTDGLTSQFAPANVIILDDAVVTVRSDGLLCTWPLPAGMLSGISNDSPPTLPKILSISAFPNPFNPSCTIHFTMPGDGEVSLDIFDTQGRRIRTLLQASALAGRHTVHWNGHDAAGQAVAAGVYLAQVKVGQHKSCIKLTLAK